MRPLALALLAAAFLPGTLLAQAPDDAPGTPPPVRAWYGASVMLTSDFGESLGGSLDLRFTFERPDVGGVSVVLGTQAGVDEDNEGTSALYGALLGGRSFPLAEDVFVHLSVGAGFARGGRTCDFYEDACEDDLRVGPIVPVRAELHVPFRATRSFGIVVQAVPVGPVEQRFGVGLHYSFGRTLSERR